MNEQLSDPERTYNCQECGGQRFGLVLTDQNQYARCRMCGETTDL